MNTFQGLPSEVLEIILYYIPKTVPQLLRWMDISRKIKSIPIKQEYWYESVRKLFPTIANRIPYEEKAEDSSYWEKTALKFYQFSNKLLTLKFRWLYSTSHSAHILEEARLYAKMEDCESSRMFAALNSDEQKEYPFIQNKLIYDVDTITDMGIVGLVKYRRQPGNKFESLITFWEKPSWVKILSVKVNFLCHLTKIQTIWMNTATGVKKMRFFSVAVGTPVVTSGEIQPQQLVVYRLLENDIQCIAHLNLGDTYISTDVFFFSQASWRTSSDGDVYTAPEESVKDWLRIVAPEHKDFCSQSTVFVIVFATMVDGSFGALPFKLNIDNTDDFDPLANFSAWMHTRKAYTYKDEYGSQKYHSTEVAWAWSSSFRELSFPKSGTHFSYPPQLSHLVAWKKWDGGLLLFDWRFGIKVGVLPHVNWAHETRPLSVNPQQNTYSRMDMELECQCGNDFKIILLLPKDPMVDCNTREEIMKRGLRLVSVDYNFESVEIKSWDITYLLDVNWCPFNNQFDSSMNLLFDMHIFASIRFPWWDRANPYLKFVASSNSPEVLPYSPKNFEPMLKDHYYSREDGDANINIHTFKVFGASVVLLTDTNELFVIDLDSGHVLTRCDLKNMTNGDYLHALSACKYVDLLKIDDINYKEIIVNNNKILVQSLLK